MPDPLNRQRGFSLPEVMLAMVLMVMIVTALSGRLAANPAVPVFIACELAG